MYTKAWVIPWTDGPLGIGIAFLRDDGLKGLTTFHEPFHPDLLELITLLNDADLKKVKERLPDVIPSARP
jgi:hypothetical protein